mmetsp:Transcript_5601/g.23263  ORF Transcript_5601/g.23263 Transcript_5601/m.23263 type:complete len:134 (-) Transcript_5601:755-1156(-)
MSAMRGCCRCSVQVSRAAFEALMETGDLTALKTADRTNAEQDLRLFDGGDSPGASSSCSSRGSSSLEDADAAAADPDDDDDDDVYGYPCEPCSPAASSTASSTRNRSNSSSVGRASRRSMVRVLTSLKRNPPR